MYDMQYEADDIVGSVAARFEKEIPSYIITKDHDYLQLVNDYTRVWLIQTKQETADELLNKYGAEYGFNSKMVSIPDKAFEVTPPLCLSEYGVRPEQIPDLKGIQGDTSDNIPGVCCNAASCKIRNNGKNLRSDRSLCGCQRTEGS